MNILIFFLVSGWIEGWCRVSGNYLDLHPESSWFASNIYMVTQSLKIAGRYNISNLKDIKVLQSITCFSFCLADKCIHTFLVWNMFTESFSQSSSDSSLSPVPRWRKKCVWALMSHKQNYPGVLFDYNKIPSFCWELR